LLYTTKDPRPSSNNVGNLELVFEIDLQAIKKLKRATALMNKAIGTAADWLTEKELLGSGELEDASGKVWRFTALPEKDELFNRLIAVGEQRWENL
jgi:hypothetical protein